MYAVVNWVAVVFVATVVTETRGQSLEVLQHMSAGRGQAVGDSEGGAAKDDSSSDTEADGLLAIDRASVG